MVKLPAKIERYLNLCIPSDVSVDKILGVQLEQVGELRSSPTGSWIHFTANQYTSASDTQFTWTANFKLFPFVTGVAVDEYESGTGRLDVKLWGCIPMVRARGPEVDRGEVQRYLAELAWNPMAFRNNDRLCFSENEDGSIRVGLKGDEETYVDLQFDNDTGEIVGTKALRSNGTNVLPWAGNFHDYAVFDGIRMPSRGEVSWETPEGKFVYWRGEVVSSRMTHKRRSSAAAA